MEQLKLPKYYSTNGRAYYAIAREAFELMKEDDAKNIRSRQDGQPGFVKTIDPYGKSFKNALICIVFCGIYLEATLHLLIGKKLGMDECKRLDRKSYEEKLHALGCNDETIIVDAGKFRESRKEVVHEKALLTDDDLRIAQREAEFAFNLVERIKNAFCIPTKTDYKNLWA
jgi:hypothetical protein